MNTQHTPGPWGYEYDNADDSGGGQWYEIRANHPSGGDGHNLLWCSYRASDERLATIKANARLMAAAPDMLALLIELVDMEGPQPGNAAWARKVNELIEKVTP